MRFKRLAAIAASVLTLGTGIAVPSAMLAGSAGASTSACLNVGPQCGDNENPYAADWTARSSAGGSSTPILSGNHSDTAATQDFIRTGNGPYRYELAPNGHGTGYCVSDPAGGDPNDASPDGIETRVCNTGAYQQFYIGNLGNGGSTLVNVATGLAVTPHGIGAQLTGDNNLVAGSYWGWHGGSTVTPSPTPTTPTPTPTTTSPTPTPTPTDTGNAPAMPTAVPSGFSRVFSEDFNTPAALGSFDSVYGSQFGEYTGCCSTNGFTQYSSAKVLSVSNGSMFYKLHSENGTSYAAAPQPWNENSFLYGQVGMSVKLDSTNGPGYKIAFLLWPATNQWTNEVDFPEVDPDFTAPIRAVSLNTTTANGSHTFCGPLDTGYHLTDGKYHTFLLTWTPGAMSASIDGQVVENFPASCIPSQAMRVSLQAEGWINQGAVPSGTVDNLEVPYVYINKYTG